jgi:tetratricopeptide (TPR) repeat protein
MPSVSNLACLGLLFLMGATGCQHLPNPDVDPGADYPRHIASSEAEHLLEQIQALGVHDPKNDLLLLKRYVPLCPWDVQSWESLASSEFEAHQYQLALNEYLALLKYVRTHDTPQWDFDIENQSRVWLTIADCYEELNQPKPALEYYRKALELSTPELPTAGFYTHYRFAKAYLQLKDYCDAYYHFQLMRTNDLVHPEQGMDFYNEIKSKIPEDPCRHRPGAN